MKKQYSNKMEFFYVHYEFFMIELRVDMSEIFVTLITLKFGYIWNLNYISVVNLIYSELISTDKRGRDCQ